MVNKRKKKKEKKAPRPGFEPGIPEGQDICAELIIIERKFPFQTSAPSNPAQYQIVPPWQFFVKDRVFLNVLRL